MFSPVETGTLWEYFGFQRVGEGLPSNQVSPEAIANPEGRELSRVMATGTITVSMNVTQRNMGRHRYMVSID